MKYNLKKAAMFGLDARIALAIFGALSVISGAALYSAIQDSKVTALVSEINEVEKAVDSMYLDLGYLPSSQNYKNDTSLYHLLVNFDNDPRWNGPYFDKINNNTQLDYILYNQQKSNSDYRNILLTKKYEYIFLHIVPTSCTASGGYSAREMDYKRDVWVYHQTLTIAGRVDRGIPIEDLCGLDVSFLKKVHDKLEKDNNYYDGNVIIVLNPDDSTKGALTILQPENLNGYTKPL